MSAIQTVIARDLVGALGGPAVEAEVVTESGATGRAVVACAGANGPDPARIVGVMLGPAVQGMDALDQPGIDQVLESALESTEAAQGDRAALLAVSLAVARAAAEAVELPLWRYLGGAAARLLPTPLVAVPLAATAGVEVLVVPRGAASFGDALRLAGAVMRSIEGMAPLAPRDAAASIADALAHTSRACEAAGCKPGDEVALAIDARGEGWQPQQLLPCLEDCRKRFPLISIVRPLAVSDSAGWASLVAEIGEAVQLVADGAAGDPPKGVSATTISPDAVGTVSGTLEAIRIARERGLRPVVARRDTDTEDTFLADLAVATNAGQILAGTFAQASARYNQLARIAWALGDGACYAGAAPFARR